MAVFRRPATEIPPSDDNDDRPASDSTSVDNGDYVRVPTPAAASRVPTPPASLSPTSRKRVVTGTPAPPLDPLSTPVPPPELVSTPSPTPKVVETTPAPKPVDSPAVGTAVVTAVGTDRGDAQRQGDVQGQGDAKDGADHARRWRELMVSFVDEPSEAVDAARALVSAEVARVTRVLERERDRLHAGTAPAPSTEDLRLTLRALRALSERLHAIT